MRKNYVYAGLLGCFVLSIASVAQASVYSFSFGYSQIGEADWVFKGRFDSSKANSGAGVLQFFPIQAEGPPFSENVTGADIYLSPGTGLDGGPVLKVGTNFSFGFPFEEIASYFFETPTGYQLDTVDTSSNIYESSLTLIGPSTVPLPAAAPMFGVALAGLAAAGLGWRRKVHARA